MALIKCSECHKEVSSSAKVCPHCGIKLSIKVCPECGTNVSENDSTCPKCGFPIQKKTTQNIINENLDKITGATSKNYVTFKDLFKDTFKKHTDEDLDEVFVCGSKTTTPDVKDLKPQNARAWVYFKIFIFFLIAYIATRIGYINYGNLNFLPAMIILGAFAVPVSILIFFFEINLFKNIPFYKVLKYFILGGALSLLLAILYFDIIPVGELDYKGAIMVGLIEEAAKAVIVAVFLFKSKKSEYILNGLLVGAAVGAGFAAFETAGYILKFGLSGGDEAMLQIIGLRGFLAPGGHVAWAAIEGAALMYVKGFDKLKKENLNDRRFIILCLISAICHAIWDMPIELPYYIVQISLTIAAWLVIIYFINLGLKQIDDAKQLESNKK